MDGSVGTKHPLTGGLRPSPYALHRLRPLA